MSVSALNVNSKSTFVAPADGSSGCTEVPPIAAGSSAEKRLAAF